VTSPPNGRVRREVAVLPAAQDPERLREHLAAMARTPVETPGRRRPEREVISAQVHRYLAVALLDQAYLSATTGVTSGKIRLGLVGGFLAQRLLFVRDLERKPVSLFWFRVVWPLVRGVLPAGRHLGRPRRTSSILSSPSSTVAGSSSCRKPVIAISWRCPEPLPPSNSLALCGCSCTLSVGRDVTGPHGRPGAGSVGECGRSRGPGLARPPPGHSPPPSGVVASPRACQNRVRRGVGRRLALRVGCSTHPIAERAPPPSI
jgi:hypothetical protein